MALEHSFIVDLTKNNRQTKENDQKLFCSCGAKHKIKAKVRRVLVKTSESNYEDKCDFDKISCKSCGQDFDLTKNIFTLRSGKIALVQISFEKDTLHLANKTQRILYRVRRHCKYNPEKDTIEEFVIRESIVYDDKSNTIRFFSPNKNLNIFDENSLLHMGQFYSNTVDDLAKTTYVEFDLSQKDFLKHFFHFSSVMKYENIQTCFDYFMEIISLSMDKDFLLSEPFFIDFTISSQITTENREGFECQFVPSRNPFGGPGTIKRKLDVGDYLHKLCKMGHIAFIFTIFPPISTLAKMKGIDFVLESYSDNFFAPIRKLLLYKSTKPQRIVELCCINYYNALSISSLTENTPEFKFSSNILRLLKTHQDALVITKFYMKSILGKSEIESLFLKYDSQDIIKLMSHVLTTSNIRNTKLHLRHYHHILKNNIFDDSSNDWLTIYYDTMNILNLILKIIEENKEKNINKKKLKKFSRFSELKIFETKNFSKLKDLHDEMSAIYRALEDDEKDSIYRSSVKKYKNLNQEHDFFRFTVIPNLKELSQEGMIMKHCIYTYLNDIVKGNYLAMNVKDTISKEMATLGLKLIKDKLYLQQLKGYENSRATELMINAVIEFCKKNEIIIKSDSMHSTDFQPNEMLEKRMKNYKDKSKSLIIRQKSMQKK